MNICIAGGGRVGFHLARILSRENHDVTVVESDPTQLEQVDYMLDVRTVLGNAASALLLQQAGVDKSDLFVSLSGSDEVNLIAATTAKGLGAKTVVARVQDPVYVESSILYETILGVDYILSAAALSALEVTKFIDNPGMLTSDEFARGRVRMRQFRVTKTPTFGGKTLKDVPLPSGVLLCLIVREGAITIPHGNAVVKEGDLLTMVGEPKVIGDGEQLFHGQDPKAEKVVIMGGGAIGLHLAKNIEQRLRTVKILEIDLGRCHYLAAQLTKAKVVCRDATSRLSLEQEHIAGADLFVSTTRDDARNILGAVLAKEVGARQSLAIVHQYDFAPVVGKLGIDHAVTPRACLANRVLKLVSQGAVSFLSVLEEGRVEILEVELKPGAPAANKRLADVRLPEGALVTTILRGDEVIVPGGADELRAGDSVIVLSTVEALDAVKKQLER